MRILITTADYGNYRIHFDALAKGIPHRWGDSEFHYQPDGGSYDAWVVWQSQRGLPEAMTVRCPATRTLLVLREPPDILTLPDDFTRQFGGVLGPDPKVLAKELFFSQFGQVWHVERNREFLTSYEIPEKTQGISAVTSNKADTSGQRRRLSLLETLKGHFGEKLIHFGRGFRPTDSKWDAIWPFRYHLALENGSWPHYWSEKVCDAWLGWSLPFYTGCQTLEQDVPPEAFIRLDAADHSKAVQQIEEAISNDEWRRRLPAIEEARRLVLEKYHIYPTLLRTLASLPNSTSEQVTLRPAFSLAFSSTQKWRFRLARLKKMLPSKVHATVHFPHLP